jgi:hypothetical protein
MPAGNGTNLWRSGARPSSPLDFGPTDPFGRLDCLLLPLPILSDRSTCDCAWSTRTDRRWSDRNDPFTGGDAPPKIWNVSMLSLVEHNSRAVLPRGCGREHLGTGPLVHSAPLPRRAGPVGSPSFVDVSPRRPGRAPTTHTAEPHLRTADASREPQLLNVIENITQAIP